MCLCVSPCEKLASSWLWHTKKRRSKTTRSHTLFRAFIRTGFNTNTNANTIGMFVCEGLSGTPVHLLFRWEICQYIPCLFNFSHLRLHLKLLKPSKLYHEYLTRILLRSKMSVLTFTLSVRLFSIDISQVIVVLMYITFSESSFKCSTIIRNAVIHPISYDEETINAL